MDDEVRYISGPLLQQLDLDLQECESESSVVVSPSSSLTAVSRVSSFSNRHLAFTEW